MIDCRKEAASRQQVRYQMNYRSDNSSGSGRINGGIGGSSIGGGSIGVGGGSDCIYSPRSDGAPPRVYASI